MGDVIVIATVLMQEGLTTGGIAMMVGCMGFVLGLCLFCVVRLLRDTNPAEHHHVPLDIDTHDTDDS